MCKPWSGCVNWLGHDARSRRGATAGGFAQRIHQIDSKLELRGRDAADGLLICF